MKIRYNKWIYDLETYPNCFTMAIVREDGKFPHVFECSTRMNQAADIFKVIDYLEKELHSMVGFNNLGFDYPVLHEFILLRDRKLSGAEIARKMYSAAQKQIDSMKEGGFPRTIPLDEVVVPQIDLYKIHHFDNKAKATGLKMIEFNMRSDNIEDLPYEVGKILTDEEIDNLKVYNLHDVEMTRRFYLDTKPMIAFREDLTNKYDRNFMNHNDTKIGKDYFIMSLEQQGIKTTKFKDGKKVLNQTKRDKIHLKDCIFSYYNFKRKEFIAVLEWFKKQTITETKGVFSDLTEYELGDVAQYAEMEVKRVKFKTKPTDKELQEKRKENPKGWVEEEELKATEYLLDDSGAIVEDYPLDEFGNKDTTKKKKKVRVPKKSYYWCWNQASTLNVVINGFRFDFGVGGIHGSITSKIARSTKRFRMTDADVSSMYPNLAIANDVYPEHLGIEFCTIYQDVYNQRKSYPKGSTENAMLKLALNGVYGDSNNKFSPFYDPQYTMKITINGQLSLCLLAEQLMEIPDMRIVQVNTDGITIVYPREYGDMYNEICTAWQDQVGLQLEYAEYDRMIIRDVNNYIAVYTDGKVKRKGAYQYEGLGWHQNQGGLVIPMAAEAKMLHGVDILDFLKNHKNKFDFMLRTKVPRSSKLILRFEDGTEELQQNICRYYCSEKGGKLIKIMPPLPGKESNEDREMQIDKEWNVKTCNDISEFNWDIDYAYYLTEAEKLIIQ